MPVFAAPVIDLALPHSRSGSPGGITILGSAGTSSEQVESKLEGLEDHRT